MEYFTTKNKTQKAIDVSDNYVKNNTASMSTGAKAPALPEHVYLQDKAEGLWDWLTGSIFAPVLE